jgi:predicted DNA-binding transcriptional regulator AlpA
MTGGQAILSTFNLPNSTCHLLQNTAMIGPSFIEGANSMGYEKETALLDEGAAAVFLSLSARTLQRYRATGGGPRYLRTGKRRLAYARADLIAWLQGRGFDSLASEYRVV